MFRSLALESMSVGSAASCGKSSAASSYDSSSKSNKWKNDLKNDLTEMNIGINKLTVYEISCISGGQGLANFGISVLNLFGGKYDYPDHWFLIAETKPKNFIKDVFQILSFSLALFSAIPNALGHEDKTNVVDKQVKECLARNIKGLCDPENNMLYEIYEEEIMADLVKKLKEIKETKELIDLLKDLDNEKYTKPCYFLIEKGANGKVVKPYKTKKKILDDESENYYNNECNKIGQFYMKNKTTIKELKRYVETLSNSYNLIDDNCQVFVRNILDHYNLQ